MQRLGEELAGETESHVGMPEMKITVGPGRICPDECGHRTPDQQDSAGGFEPGKFLEWPDESFYWRDFLQRPAFVGHRIFRLLVIACNNPVSLQQGIISRVLI